MKKKPHIARGEGSDRRDFLVAQATLKLEVDDFTLIAGECLEDVEDPAERLTGVVLPVEVVDDRDFDVIERRRTRRLFTGIERQVAADCEQPGREMSVDSRWILPAEPQEGLLHDVPCHLRVAEQPLCVSE